MNMKRIGLAMTAALGMLPVTASFAEGFYFGLGGGISMPDLPSKAAFDAELGVPVTSSLDDSGTGWGVQVGYRFIPYFAAEVGYIDLGEARYDATITATGDEYSVRYLSTGVTLSAIGMFPIGPRFDVHGRLGLYWSDTRIRDRIEDPFTGDFLSVEAKGSDQDLIAGIGGAWNINESYSLRLEYQRFMDVGDEDETGEQDVDLLMFSVLFR